MKNFGRMRILAAVLGTVVLALVATVLIVQAQGPVGSEYTNFQIQNLTGDTANVAVVAYNPDGTVAGSDSTTIAPYDYVSYSQAPVATDPLGLPNGWRGSIVIYSDVPVATICNQFVYTEYPPTIAAAYTGVSEGNDHWELPLMFRDYNTWNSRFAVQNTSSLSATVNMTYTLIPAGTISKTDSVVIPPNGAYYRELFTDDSDLGSQWQGAVTLHSDQDVAAIADAYYTGYGGYQFEMNYNGITDDAADTTVYLPVLFRKYLEPQFGWNTNIFVTNLGTSPANVEIEYTGGGITGSVTETATIATSARFQQYSNTALPDGWAGSGKITSDEPIAAVVIEATSTGANDRSSAYSGIPQGETTNNVSIPMLMKMYVGLWNTNFTIQNAGVAPANVTVTYDGGSLASSLAVPLLVTDTVWVSQFSEAGLPMDWRGNASLSSDQPITVVVNENSITPGDLSETYNALNY